MKGLKFPTRASVLALGLMLAGCGGGGGVNSTPAPTPTPPSYTKVSDYTGDHTFQTGGVQYDVGGVGVGSGFGNGSNLKIGSGVKLAYTASTDTYVLTAPDGTGASFGPANLQPPPPVGNAQQWIVDNGTTRDVLTLIAPTNGSGVALSYTVVGTWGHLSDTTNSGTYRIAVGGSPTLASDMPKTGTASYDINVGGGAVDGAGAHFTLSGHSSGSFSTNFATGAITTSLTLAGAPNSSSPVTSFGTFDGTGTITSGGPGFTGTLSGNGSTGNFSGAFFGPQATEVGFGYFLSSASLDATFSAVGAVTGSKK